jgi:uncharacterized repeat protein (TIGR01451 family)
MTLRERTAGLAFLVFCGCLAALTCDRPLQGAFPFPLRVVQREAPSSPEPPLADAPAAPVPAAPRPADPPVPVVSVRVRVLASGAVGQDLVYHICVENCSRAAAHHVLLRNPLPAYARFVRATPEPSAGEPELVWELGTLEPCTCREIVLVLQPTGEGDVKNCARVQFEHGQCVVTKIPRPELTVRKAGPKQAVLYDAMTFELVVSNSGSVPVTDVKVTDTLPEGLEAGGGTNPLTWDVGTLAPGQGKHIEYQVIAKKPGSWCNKAVVTAAGGLRQESSVCVTVGEPKLQLTKTGPEQRFVNRPATYQLTVTNAGTTPVSNVILTDPVPEKTKFVSATNGGTLVNNQVQWLMGTLEPGTRRTVQVVLRASEAGEVINQATVRADRDLMAEAKARTLFEGATGLTVDVDDKDDPIEVGGQTTYTISVLNQGAVPATKVVVTALVPEQMEMTGAKGPMSFRQEGRTVVFEPITIQPKQEVGFEVTVKALKAGDVRFKVDVSADQLPAGPVHREESTTIYDPNTGPLRPQPAMP